MIGPDTGGTYDDLAFALPANAGAAYCKRKIAAATERLGDRRGSLGGPVMTGADQDARR